MTKKARDFLAANQQSPVVYGSVIGDGGKGCVYRLHNGTMWRLNRLDCLALGLVGPRWALFEAAA